MRQLFTAFLLLVFATSLPFGDEVLRYCLLEHRVISAIEGGCEATVELKCCDGCAADSQQTHPLASSACCLEFKKLPDSTLPAGLERAPLFDAVELPALFMADIFPMVEWKSVEILTLQQDHVPRPPSERRAMLGVWRV